ncbi:MAG: Vps62-related protein [Planctomycetes bacterium]|nr:Vps62-related protein [Planctomycetota bacterium]
MAGWNLTWTVTGQPTSMAYLLLDTNVNWSGVSLSSYGLTNCRWWLGSGPVSVPRWLGLAGTAGHSFAIPSSIAYGTHLYGQAGMIAYGANPAGAVMSELRVARIGSEPNLSVSEIRDFSPLVRIHPNETYNPMDPMQFIRLSRFRHHRGWQSDQGYNKVSQSWVTTNSTAAAYYDIPVAFIDSYGLNGDGTNRRPRDSNSGSTWNVFLQPNGAPTGDATPTGSVPAFYYYRRSGDLHEIQYWWFSGYNDAAATFNHQGDWEHVTVHVRHRQIEGVYFAAHNGGTYHPRSQLRFSGGRPVVYMARGSHASYSAPGTYNYGTDQAADGGHQWDIRSSLQRLSSQPWRNFAGAWGEVGTLSTTTGPLGPWHKRTNP